MKILVFSDSHDNPKYLAAALREHKGTVDLAIHLGDGLSDMRRVGDLLEGVATATVIGNGEQFFERRLWPDVPDETPSPSEPEETPAPTEPVPTTEPELTVPAGKYLLTLTADKTEVKAGETLTVTLHLKNCPNVASFGFTVTSGGKVSVSKFL